ncbi:hypothetical protein SEA_AVAZAK_12 [Gordonia phage Avazak]|uniref:Phosphoesterase n=1 Tax=Gordonia phage Avazak TaxID=2656529 RepID=A0A649V6Z9_9CAUD|nr:hypothetical protein HWC78_gp12 [Gordonia phage Avazak]QGJ87994.1 hypothetical protein SEA_AVAZAK_12 [Gordonia phage Avazak]
MTSWAIVAVPEDGESVWKISSEKVPHMTILFLGEQSDPEKALHITQYLQHAVQTSLNKFGATVRNRGILGDESADVLFFEGERRLKQVMDFRSFLLADPVINECFNSTEQFDGWTPHLTLGYPARPARKPEGLHSLPLYAVYFDKIALWVDDFDGPTFNLEYEDEYAMAMDSLAHRQAEAATVYKTPETARDVVMRNVLARKQLREPSNLKHHGIGARKVDYKNPIEEAIKKTVGPAGVSARELNNAGRFFKHAISGALQHGSTADPKKIYVRENQLAFIRHLDHAVGGRPSERAGREFDLATRLDGDWILSSIDRVAHTATVESHIHPVIDEYGRIQNYEIVHDQLTEDDMRCALVHYGVRGMKWGVRRKSPDDGGGSSSGGSGGSSGSGGSGGGSAAGKSKLAERRDRKAAEKRAARSEDANNAADLKQKLKTTKSSSMSNQEMQQLITRLQLESQLASAMEKNPKTKSEGRKFVESLVIDTAKVAVKQAVQEAATKQTKSFLNSRLEDAMNRRSSS